MRLQSVMDEKNVSEVMLAYDIQLPVFTIEDFLKYHSVPVPEDLDKICAILGCDVSDIYEREEIRYKYPSKRKAEEDCYKVTVRLPPEAKRKIAGALKTCGYMTVSDWLRACYARLLAQERKIKEAEAAATASAKRK